MPKFVTQLQDEIARLARREALKVEKPLKLTANTLKRENVALKKQIAALVKTVAGLQKIVIGEKQLKAEPTQEEIASVKFSPKVIVRLRKKHGLSRLKMAKLLGINHKSIGRWEQEKGVPQSESKKKLLAFKAMTKSAVSKMLKELIAKKGPATPKTQAAPKKAVTKKAVAKKRTAKKAVAKKAVAKKAVAKKAVAKKAIAKKAVAKKAIAKKAIAKKAAAKKRTAKKKTDQ